nr:MAG TPA: restriction endonuclease [Caudoviricetes sp.]
MVVAAKSPGKRAVKKEEEPKYLCPYCNKEKKASEFYMSSDPLVMTGKTTMCKECAEKIARNWDGRTGEFGDCTKASVQEALERLDKPYLDKIWDASYFEYINDKNPKKRSNIWASYIKNIGLPQYKTLRWRDGDLFTSYKETALKQAQQEIGAASDDEIAKSQEINEEYEKNRSDVIRLLGYDPFAKEQEDDKPLLYSQLIGYLDTSGENDDMMRTSSAITIVRGFLQQSKLDDMIAKAMSSPNVSNKSGEIKTYLDSKQKVASTVSQLAEQSCLSLKHNKSASKGENTWTGKIKKLKELNLREAEVNGFDIGTCRGMQQVLEMSDASIMKQLNLDESEWSDMVAEQRQKLIELQNSLDVYKEINRLLLRENIDLRDTLNDAGMLDESNLQNLKELFSPFGDTEVDADGDEDE